MGEDVSIDEFAAPADDGDDGAGNDGSGNGDDDGGANGDGTDDEEETEKATAVAGGEDVDSVADTSGHDAGVDTEPNLDVVPTVTTYGWAPRNATCEACGESVRERWRDDGAMVCRDCKEW